MTLRMDGIFETRVRGDLVARRAPAESELEERAYFISAASSSRASLETSQLTRYPDRNGCLFARGLEARAIFVRPLYARAGRRGEGSTCPPAAVSMYTVGVDKFSARLGVGR